MPRRAHHAAEPGDGPPDPASARTAAGAQRMPAPSRTRLGISGQFPAPPKTPSHTRAAQFCLHPTSPRSPVLRFARRAPRLGARRASYAPRDDPATPLTPRATPGTDSPRCLVSHYAPRFVAAGPAAGARKRFEPAHGARIDTGYQVAIKLG